MYPLLNYFFFIKEGNIKVHGTLSTDVSVLTADPLIVHKLMLVKEILCFVIPKKHINDM